MSIRFVRIPEQICLGLLALLGVFLFRPAYAGNHSEPSLAELIRKLTTLAEAQKYEDIIDLSADHFEEVDQNGNPDQKTNFYLIVGNAYLTLGNSDSALLMLDKGETIARQNNLKESLPHILNLQSKAYFYLGNIDDAYSKARRAGQLGQELEQWMQVSNAYVALGNFHYHQRDLDSAIFYYRQSVSVSNKANTPATTTLMNIGIIWDTRGKVDSALYYYLAALKQSEADSNHLHQAQVLQNLGTFYDDRGDYGAALGYYQQALNFFDTIGDQANKLIVQYNMANVLVNRDTKEEAISALQEVLEKSRELRQPEIEKYCLISLAQVYYDLKEEGKLRKSLDSLTQYLKRSPDKFVETELMILEGQYYQSKGRLAEAIEYGWKAKQLAEETNQATTLIDAHILLANNYELSGKVSNAIDHGQTALTLARENGFMESAFTASNLLSGIYQKTGNYKQAYEYLESAQAFRDSLSEDRAQAEMNRLILQRLEREHQELENDQAIQKAQLAASKAELGKQQFLFIAAVAIVIILALLIVSLYYNRYRLKRINALLKLQNKRIEQQNTRLNQLNKDKDRLMHVVAHDLRNPLNGIKGLSQVLQDEIGSTGTLKQGMDHIHRSAEHALDTINDLLSLESTQYTELITTEVDINQLVQDVIFTHRQHAQSKHIQIHFEAKAPIIANTDGDKLQRIIDNLVSNAIKFSPNEREIHVSLQQVNGQFKLEVQDQGPGLTEEDQQKVFGKFQKLSARPTAGESSTGLGLSIVRDLAEALGGKVEVQSTAGEGAKFIVQLPRQAPKASNGRV